jgi:hypothetical protein
MFTVKFSTISRYTPILFLSATFIALHADGATFDPPDLNLEYQMHKAFSTSGTSKNLNEDQQGRFESYRLQKGENLWSLSQMLYGDGSYWPKVWAQNRSITNPHLVRPGHTLQLLLGSEDDTPAFRFSEDDGGGVELAAATVATGTSEIEIPPPEVKPKPVIKIPSSFPKWQEVFRKAPDELLLDDSQLKAKYAKFPQKVRIDGYVQDQPLASQGVFLENEHESGVPVPNQYAYVKVNKGVGKAGLKMLIVKDHGLLKSKHDEISEDITANFIEIFGDLELVELAEGSFKDSEDREKFDIYRALFLHVNSLTRSNYDLIPGEVQDIDLSDQGPMGSAVAQVIGSSKDKTSVLYGPGEIVFLNRGSKHGVQVGQLLDIYIDRKIRDSQTPVGLAAYPSGRVKIARVDGSCSTGILIRSVDGIRQGDHLQTGNRQSKAEVPDLSTDTSSDLEGSSDQSGSGDELEGIPEEDLSE